VTGSTVRGPAARGDTRLVLIDEIRGIDVLYRAVIPVSVSAARGMCYTVGLSSASCELAVDRWSYVIFSLQMTTESDSRSRLEGAGDLYTGRSSGGRLDFLTEASDGYKPMGDKTAATRTSVLMTDIW
jgi:hypothetical protein